MKIEIDKNNLLTISNESIPQTKEYTYTTGGYTFSDFDKWIIVLHKKEIKIINLKNLGDNMSVVYVAPRKEIITPFDHEAFTNWMCLFDGFDETSGKKYFFIPKFAEKNLESINNICKKLGIQTQIKKTEKWFFVEENSKKTENTNNLSFLYALVVLYGKLEIKKDELIAIKAHIPLFGQFLNYEEFFSHIQKDIANQGIFISTSSQKSNDGVVYQISCNDYEVLKNIAEYHKGIENINKIPKYELALETKKQFIEFIQTNPEIPTEGKSEVIKQIQAWTIKLLTK